MFKEERNPFFKTIKESLITQSGIIIPDKKVLINSETNDILGIVSKNYEVVSNEMVSAVWMDALSDMKIASINDHLDATTKRWKRQIIFAEDKLNFQIAGPECVGIMLELFNGYDARTSFGYELMGYRWACENGLVTGKKKLLSGNFAHYNDNPRKFRESIDTKWPLFMELAETWKGWTQIPFNFDKFEEFVDSKKYITPRVGKYIKDEYKSSLDTQNLDDSKWGAFNALTYLSTHMTKARKGSNLFSNRYKTINRLAEDLYETDM